MADEPANTNSYIVGSPKPPVTPVNSENAEGYLADAAKTTEPHIEAPSSPAAAKTHKPEAAPVKAQLKLPLTVITTNDVGRLIREAEAVDNFLQQAAIRQPGTTLQLPRASRLFDEIVAVNKLNLLQNADRKNLSEFLQLVHDKAPVLHISFNSDPSPMFLQKLIAWIRQQMHPFILLQVGLHPSIGAGCVLRTTNKYFDFSLRQRFNDQRQLLISKLREIDEKAAANTVTPAKEPVT